MSDKELNFFVTYVLILFIILAGLNLIFEKHIQIIRNINLIENKK